MPSQKQNTKAPGQGASARYCFSPETGYPEGRRVMTNLSHSTDNYHSFTQIDAQKRVPWSLSHAFRNKVNTAGQGAFAHSFLATTSTLTDLAEHITSGGAFAMGTFRDNHRKRDNFIQAQIIGVDLDNGPDVAGCLRDTFVRDHAWFVGPSASSAPDAPKTRILFALDAPITDAADYERAILRVYNELQIRGFILDVATKDAGRFYYGSTVPGASERVDRVLPLATIANLPEPETRQELPPDVARTPYTPPESGNGSQAQAYLKSAVERACEAIAQAASGTRNVTLNSQTFAIGQLTAGLNASDAGIQNALISAGRASGLSKRETESTVISAWLKGTQSPRVPETYNPDNGQRDNECRTACQELKEKPLAKQATAVNLPEFPTSQSVNMRYVSDLDAGAVLDAGDVVIRSPLATGKTELLRRLDAEQERRLGHPQSALYLTPTAALNENAAERLGFECYSRIAKNLHAAPRIAITLNSLFKLSSANHYNTVFIDEVESVIRYFASRTLKRGTSRRAYEALRTFLQSADHVIALDAHASALSVKWLAHMTGRPVHAIDNEYRPEWSGLTFCRDSYRVQERAFASIQAGELPTVIPCGSKTDSERMYRLVIDKFGPDGVLLINRDTSTGQECQDFLRNINERLSGLRVLIHSPSIGTGVDIQTPVNLFGIFPNRPLTATAIMQMIARYRNASERAVYVQHLHSRQSTDWKNIYQRHAQLAQRTDHAADFVDHDDYIFTDGGQTEVLRLQAAIQASDNRQRSDLFSYTVAYASDAGFSVGFDDTHGLKATRKAWRETKQLVRQERQTRTLDAAPVNGDELRAHRIAGTLTPEIRAGYERWKIETGTGYELTPELYDLYHTKRARRALGRLADRLGDRATLQDLDRQEHSDGVLLMRRSHFTVRRDFVDKSLSLVFGSEWLDAKAKELTEEQIEARIGAFIQERIDTVKVLIDGRADYSERMLPILRRIAGSVGYRIVGRRVRGEDNKRVWLYSLCQETAKQTLTQARNLLRFRQTGELSSFEDKSVSIRESGQAPIERRSKHRSVAKPTPAPLAPGLALAG